MKNFFSKKKKGNILTENLIFIILNLVFLSILILFLFTKMSGAAVLEEKYAKEIALMIDSAEPGMTINLDMEDAFKITQKEGINSKDIVKIENNIVTVKLRDNKGYSYSFFNDVKFTDNYYPNENKFVFVII